MRTPSTGIGPVDAGDGRERHEEGSTRRWSYSSGRNQLVEHPPLVLRHRLPSFSCRLLSRSWVTRFDFVEVWIANDSFRSSFAMGVSRSTRRRFGRTS